MTVRPSYRNIQGVKHKIQLVRLPDKIKNGRRMKVYVVERVRVKHE